MSGTEHSATDSASCSHDARATLLTPRGRGAIAVIELAGPPGTIARALERCWQPATPQPWSDVPLGSLRYGTWRGLAEPHTDADAPTTGESIVVARISDEVAEIHCHGGVAASEQILADLRHCGVATQATEEWMSPEGPSLGEPGREARLAWQRVTTETAAARLWHQHLSVWPQTLSHWREWIEQADFRLLRESLAASLDWFDYGRHLIEPWRVVLFGRPNVGKSSLLNAVVGYERAIVFERPGTTRDLVTASTVIAGLPFEFCDTAGLREATGTIEQVGVQLATDAIERADLPVLVLDATEPLTSDERGWLADHPQALVVLNKRDLGLSAALSNEPLLAARSVREVSARTGEGVDQFLQSVRDGLVPREPALDQPVPWTERQRSLLEEGLLMLQGEAASATAPTSTELAAWLTRWTGETSVRR